MTSYARPVAELLQPALDDLEARSSRSRLGGVELPTGFTDLDSLTGGLRRGGLWAITGRSGSGKSVLALDLARNLAVRHGRQVELAVSQESGADVVHRLLAAESRVGLHGMRNGTMGDDDWARFARRMNDVADAPLHLAELSEEKLLAYEPAPDTQVLLLDHLPHGPGRLDVLRELTERPGLARWRSWRSSPIPRSAWCGTRRRSSSR